MSFVFDTPSQESYFSTTTWVNHSFAAPSTSMIHFPTDRLPTIPPAAAQSAGDPRTPSQSTPPFPFVDPILHGPALPFLVGARAHICHTRAHRDARLPEYTSEQGKGMCIHYAERVELISDLAIAAPVETPRSQKRRRLDRAGTTPINRTAK
ncbi:hypothetical protein Tdes44962_MAKER09604 [Teratosphaeria destructans]|uniref:Uncharacterized protein n=1 Tax=Teratosphaeria destructans TaxID=418781 RepID=A0A9W7SSK5_9PEZI|nr:hypothetical protein Tdes44962_MAKER09604 [Teratosphaeria destructans]